MTAFVTAYHPFLLSLHVDQPALERELRGRIATFVAVALLGVGLPFAVFGPELVSVVAPGYDGAVKAISPLVLATAAYGVASVVASHAAAPPHRRVGGTVRDHGDRNIGLCLVLIPPFGWREPRRGLRRLRAPGGDVLVVGAKGRRRPLRTRPPGAAFGLAAVAGEAWRIDLSSEALTLVLKLAVCVAFVVGLRLAHVIRPEELGAVREIVERRLRAPATRPDGSSRRVKRYRDPPCAVSQQPSTSACGLAACCPWSRR